MKHRHYGSAYLVINHLLFPVIFLEHRKELNDVGVLQIVRSERQLLVRPHTQKLTSASNWSPVPSKHKTRVLEGCVGGIHDGEGDRPPVLELGGEVGFVEDDADDSVVSTARAMRGLVELSELCDPGEDIVGVV